MPQFSSPTLWLLIMAALLLRADTEEQPAFSAPAYNLSVTEGQRVILLCRVFHRGSHMVAWIGPQKNIISRNSVVATLDTRFSIKNRHFDEWNLEIEDVRLDDAGYYTCIVDTSPSTIQKDILLTVIREPTIVLGSSSKRHQVSVENKAVQLRCKAEGFPKPLVTWYRHGKKISAGVSEGTLTMLNISRNCEGRYECRANTPAHDLSASHYINLVVHYLPEIRYIRKTVAQQQQEEALLECDVSMNPVSGIVWLDQNNKEVLQGSRHQVRVDPVSKYRRRTSLRILQLQSQDFGLYACEAYNVVGTARATVRLAELSASSTVKTSTKPQLILPSSKETSLSLPSQDRSTLSPTADAVLGAVSVAGNYLLLTLCSLFVLS